MPSFTIFWILLLQSKSCHIIFQTFFPQFAWTFIFPFPYNLQLHGSMYLWFLSPWMTWPHHCKQLSTKMSSILTTTPSLSLRTPLETLSNSFDPHVALIIWRSTPSSTTDIFKSFLLLFKSYLNFTQST